AGIAVRFVCVLTTELAVPTAPRSRKRRVPLGPRIATQYVCPEVTVAAGTETVLNWPDTGAASEPEVNSAPGRLPELFAYSPATRLVAVEPVSTSTRSCVTEPDEAAVVLNASARPGAFESSFASTDWLPSR